MKNDVDSFISSTKELTRIFLTTYFISIILSIYIIQRGCFRIYHAYNPPDNIYMGLTQIKYKDFSITYGTLSILLPWIVTVVCIATLYFLQKKYEVNCEIKRISGKINEFEKTIKLKDYSYLYREIKSRKSIYSLLKITLYLPVLSVVMHMFVGIWLVMYLFFILKQPQISLEEFWDKYSIAIFVAFLQTIGSVISLLYLKNYSFKFISINNLIIV